MTTIDERAAAREAELLAVLGDSRRMARPEDYVFDKAQEQFWDLRDGTMHSEKAVDASIPIERWRVEVTEGADPDAAPARGRPRQRRERLIPPSRDILRVENDQFVEGSTWWPGKPQIIRDLFISGDGHFPAPGRRIYNQYREVPQPAEDTGPADRWIDHVKKLWPDPKEHEFFFNFCAHMVQRPDVKCNAAIVLSGTQGIGKDAALVAVKAAVGSWNAKGIEPDELFSPFKPWLQTLMLVVDEVRPTKDEFHASSMYNILKPMIVAPPDTLPLNDKFAKLRHIINVLRVFITTNDWMSMYIPPEDRRMFIMHSTLPQKWHLLEGKENYFIDLFDWFENQGGFGAVARWLRERDLSNFNPKAQVERTAGWNAVANTWDEPEDAIGWALDALGKPPIVLGSELLSPQFDYKDDLAAMLKSPRKIGHRMQRAGYSLVRPTKGDRWVFRGEGGHVLRSRYAFVHTSLLSGGADLEAQIESHGKKIAAGGGSTGEGF